MQLNTIVLLFGASFLAAVAHGQLLSESELAENEAKLKVSIQMDRDVYFVGELFEATFEITNPTSASLVVPQPFSLNGCLALYMKKGEELIPTAPVDAGCREVLSKLPPTTFGPGETRRDVFKSYGESFWPTLTAGGGAPDRPGIYVLSYSYGSGASAEFRVVSPKVEARTVARVKDIIYSDRADGQNAHPLPAYVDVVAARWEDQTYIVITQEDRANLERDPTANPDALNLAGRPFMRVATSREPVVSVRATADHAENLTIEWKTASGSQDRFYYPASYVVRDARDRERKARQEDLGKAK